jgi:hypothetical protein
MTNEQIHAELAKLNPAQRRALRTRFGTRKIAAFRTKSFLGKVDDIVVTFKHGDDQLIQYRVWIGPRGALKSVDCMGWVHHMERRTRVTA